MYASRLQESLPRVRDTITAAAEGVGRDPSDVTLVAVTKGHPLEAVEAALDAGLKDLGENRVGELARKAGELDRSDVRWHMIGHVQRRKAPRVVAVTDLIHSVDSLRLAQRLARVTGEGEGDGPVRVLYQVNTSGEEAKYGFPMESAEERILEAAELPELSSAGLMTMAPYTDDEKMLRDTFRRLRELLERLRGHRPVMGTQLSMGMTNDLEIAIEEGSTMIRIGTALFGERPGA